MNVSEANAVARVISRLAGSDRLVSTRVLPATDLEFLAERIRRALSAGPSAEDVADAAAVLVALEELRADVDQRIDKLDAILERLAS